jgi:hypothetical protein
MSVRRIACSGGDSKEYRLIDDLAVPEVFDDNALQKGGCDVAVPDAFGVDDDDRSACAHAEARCFTAFDSPRAE